MAAPCRACIRSRSSIYGCALSGLHSQPLINLWLRPYLRFRAIALTLRAGLHSQPLINLWLRPYLRFRAIALTLRAGLHSQPLINLWLRPVGLAFAAAHLRIR